MSPGDDTVLKELRSPALLVSRGPRQLTKLVLFPVRFLFTAATGEVGTTALAVEHYLANATQRLLMNLRLAGGSLHQRRTMPWLLWWAGS
jgi:hypothetical protein